MLHDDAPDSVQGQRAALRARMAAAREELRKHRESSQASLLQSLEVLEKSRRLARYRGLHSVFEPDDSGS